MQVPIEIAHTWDGSPLQNPAAKLLVRPGPQRWEIRVDAPFWGDPPPSSAPGSTPGLWEFEVVELFFARGDRYTEIELGPHGHYLVLQLDGRRRVIADGLSLAYEAEIHGDRWSARAQIQAHLLPAPTSFNAYAIHGLGSRRRYLAANPVPGEGPDFHRLEHFAPWPPGSLKT